MRDPGTPGRNPFFEHSGEDPFASGAGDAGGDDSIYDRTHERATNATGPRVDTSSLGTLVGLVDALGQAQPEAGEHLLAAAHELVLAVKTIVDATEAMLAAQRAALQERNAAGDRTAPDAHEPAPTSAPGAEATRPTGVYRIDLA